MKGFKPIVNAESKVLILGTFPSKDSLKVNQYYANATNLFWPLVFAVLEGTDNEKEAKRWNAVTSYKDKTKFTLKHGAALWDVLRSCERKTSADRDILKPKANSFDRLYKKYPDIKAVAFNGGGKKKNPRPKSAAWYYQKLAGLYDDHAFETLYSSSEAYCDPTGYDSLFLKKYDDWKVIRDYL